jgi:quercetin dioxygenase-like cupin family protein
MLVFVYDLPNLPGHKMTGVLVEYGPGGSSPPHHHTTKGSVVAYVLEGAIRSKVNDGPITVYEAGESWLEPPGAAHSVSENASATEPARLLAVFVAEDGAELTTFDHATPTSLLARPAISIMRWRLRRSPRKSPAPPSGTSTRMKQKRWTTGRKSR